MAVLSCPDIQRLLQPWPKEVQLLLGLVPDTGAVHVILACGEPSRYGRIRDEMERPVKQMQEREIGATEAPALRGEPRGLSLARLQGTWPLKLTSRCRTEGYRVLLAAGFGSTLPFWNASVYPESLHTASV